MRMRIQLHQHGEAIGIRSHCFICVHAENKVLIVAENISYKISDRRRAILQISNQLTFLADNLVFHTDSIEFQTIY